MVSPPIPYLGEILALATAVLWAFAIILFKKSGETAHPMALNLFKNTAAMLLFVPTIPLVGQHLLLAVPWTTYAVVLASGAIGIGVADSLFFRSLNLLGAGRSAILETLYAPFVIILSFVFLGERLNMTQGAGALMIVIAVYVANVERYAAKISREMLVEGLLLGALSHLLMAVGLVMVKRIVETHELLWVTEWRLVGGALVLAVLVGLRRDRRAVLASLAVRHRIGYLIAGAVVGAYLVLMTWLGGMKYAPASIVSALNQLSTVLTFVFAAWLLREPVTPRRAVAIALALAGAFLVSFR